MEGITMNLVKWNPWRDMSALPHRINRFFDEPFLSVLWPEDESSVGTWRPNVDIYDNEGSIVLKAELPGVDKKDIDIAIKDGVLTLKGERSYENEVKEDSYYRKERAFGHFQRSFSLPENTDAGKIKADFKDGILKVEIPKPEERKPKKITVH
jgi:HSP20 family protein